MMTSVDGCIDCPMVGQLSTDEYYIALEKLGPCSKLSGRITTALECSAVKEESTPMEGTPIGHKSVYVANKSDEYTIIVDTYGKLRWQEGEADGHPLLCIVSERVSEEYLETLRTLGISWIAAGAERIDLPQAMELLHEHFGVERLAIVGGGHICGTGPTHTNVIFDLVVPYDVRESDAQLVQAVRERIETADGTLFAVINVDRAYI